MKRLIMLIEVEDLDEQQILFDALQEMIEERMIQGYFTLVDDGKAVLDVPDYMDYERDSLIPAIAQHEAKFLGEQ